MEDIAYILKLDTSSKIKVLGHDASNLKLLISMVIQDLRKHIREFFKIPDEEVLDDFINGGNCGMFAYCLHHALKGRYGINTHLMDNDMHAWLSYCISKGEWINLDSDSSIKNMNRNINSSYCQNSIPETNLRKMTADMLLINYVGTYDTLVGMFINNWLHRYGLRDTLDEISSEYLDKVTKNQYDEKWKEYRSKFQPIEIKYKKLTILNESIVVLNIDALLAFDEIVIQGEGKLTINDEHNSSVNGEYVYIDKLLTRDVVINADDEFINNIIKPMHGSGIPKRRIHLLPGVRIILSEKFRQQKEWKQYVY